MLRSRLAEGEREGLGARVEEGDLKGSVGNRAVLPDELVKPRFGDRAVALAIHIDSVRAAGRLPVEQHAEWRGGR